MFNTKHKKLLDGLLALGLLCSPGTVWAQHGNVTLTLDNVTVKEALEQLNAQTSYSLWLNVGDTNHRVKHAESISITPVVFGIRKSLAGDLGFVGREVSVRDVLSAIESGEVAFCPSFEEVSAEKRAYVQAFNEQVKNNDPFSSRILIQKHGESYLVQNRMQFPLSEKELDEV